MFEKEAQSYAKGCLKPLDWKQYDQHDAVVLYSAFRDGAEYAYNKACKWHYVKNELPIYSGLYYIYYNNTFLQSKARCIARYSPDKKEFLNINYEDGDEVIAWMELPEPPKEIG